MTDIKRRILITNDDGIDSDGIARLAQAAKEFGEVWVVAPTHQRSAASHCITLREPIDVYPHDFPVKGVHAYSCSGTPADCVRVGGLSVMPAKPDVVLSGINFGYNVATDILKEYIDVRLGHGRIVNVNFPGCPLSGFKGILRDRKTSHDSLFHDHYNVIGELENGGLRYMIEGVHNEQAEEGTDFRAVVENYISIGIVSNVG